MKKQKKAKLGRPERDGGRGRVMTVYIRPDVEKEIRGRAEDESKSISAVISDKFRPGESK